MEYAISAFQCKFFGPKTGNLRGKSYLIIELKLEIALILIQHHLTKAENLGCQVKPTKVRIAYQIEAHIASNNSSSETKQYESINFADFGSH